jgi:hypothetical protein
VAIPSSLPRLIPPLAWTKLAAGWVAFFLAYRAGTGPREDPYFPYVLHFLCSFSIALTAGILLAWGRHDLRARQLGHFFLVLATSWSGYPLALAFAENQTQFWLPLLGSVRLQAFIPYYLWAFARDFPSTPLLFSARRRFKAWVRGSWYAGLTLLAVNLLHYPLSGFDLPAWLDWFFFTLLPRKGEGFFYILVFALVSVAIVVLIWKIVRARGQEGRRGRLLLALLVVSLTPALLEVLLELTSSRYTAYIVAHPAHFRIRAYVVLFPLLTFPLTVPYVILKQKVLDVRSIARRAIQHALARASVALVTVVPLAILVVYIARNADQRVDELVSGRNFPLLVGISALGVAGFIYRRRLLDAIDRRFFREQYDARRILTLLVDRIRSVHEVGSLASLVSQEIDLALHLEGISMLVLQPKLGVLVDLKTPSRRLDASSPLAHTAQMAVDALDVDLEDPTSPLHRLGEPELRWLGSSGFRLIVPILARDGALLGLVGLGEKKSGLPFLHEDRQLLHAIAGSAAWVLELDLLHAHPWRRTGEAPSEPEDEALQPLEPARECGPCGLLHPPHTVFCSNCSRRLVTSHVPYVLPGGRYRFERRIGIGAMGIVYKAIDLSLGRPVAIKTLRYLSPEGATRLRHEARTAAAVSDPHLAAVYGVESWQGTPMLALELLEGGTLGDRIKQAPLSPVETVELGIAMAGALGRLHQAEILHRDVKPTNIGYDGDGNPKLMDFGIARAVLDLDDLSDLDDPSTEDDDPLGLAFTSPWEEREPSLPITRRRFAGTLSYLSPEALDGDPPDSSFDLWALGVVLYECLLGRKVFGGGETKMIVARIRQGRAPDFTQVFPPADPRLAELFRSLLHKQPSRRPASAFELRDRLVDLRTYLNGNAWAREPLKEAAAG